MFTRSWFFLTKISPFSELNLQLKRLSTINWLIYFFEVFIFFVIREIFLDAVFLLIVPVFATFINCECNFGRKLLASFIFPELIYIAICFMVDLYLLFLILFIWACCLVFLVRLIADFVLGIKCRMYIFLPYKGQYQSKFDTRYNKKMIY